MQHLNSQEVLRLREAVNWSRRQLSTARENRIQAIREMVGRHYAENGAGDRVPINFIELAVNIYSRQLAARNPAVLATTKYFHYKPVAERLKLALNHLIKDRLRLQETLNEVVVESLLGVGVVKVGLCRNNSITWEGQTKYLGQLFVELVDLDDFVYDVNAKRLEDAVFIGNRYRIPLREVRDMEIFDPEVRQQVQPSSKFSGSEYDGGSPEEAVDIVRGQTVDPDEIEEMTDVIDLFLPQRGVYLTMTADQELPPLMEMAWDGPSRGPYKMLSFSKVPGNALPLPSVALWRDLHELANSLYRKLGRKAERQKDVLLVRRGGDSTAAVIQDTSDGEIAQVDDPQHIQLMKFPGIDRETLAFLIETKNLFSWFAGNLDSLGGLSPMSETLGQDRMLSESASKRIEDMGDRVVSFAQDVIRDLGWYLWTDPLVDMQMVQRIPGAAGIEIPVAFNPRERRGDFYDYVITVEPYSMRHQTPQMKLQSIMQFIERVYLPMAPMMEAQGKILNLQRLQELAAEYLNIPELNEIIVSIAGPKADQLEPPVSRGDRPLQSPNTTRTQVRVNRPGATRVGKDMALMQTLMGGQPQESEAAAMTRGDG